MGVPDDENGYFNGDLLDDYGISYTPDPEPEFHSSQRHSNRSDDPEASANNEQRLRWSVATGDSYAESQPHSPSSSNSYAGSVSDLSSAPSYPPSYSFGYGGAWSNSDRDSMTDVSRHLSLSRSISSTSISTSSIGDDIESHINFKHFHSRSTSDSGQGGDISQSVYDHHHLLLGSSALIVSSDSGANSILHSPESEWTFLSQKRIHPSHIPDMLVGPALQKLPLDNSTTDHQTQQVQGQFDSEPESKLPITSALQNSEQDDSEEAIGSHRNCHALAHDVFDASLATAEDLIPTSSALKSALKRHQESFVEPAICLTTPSDQRSSQHILDETFRSRASSSTLNPSEHPEHVHLESEPADLHEMNGTDKWLREKMTQSGQHSHLETVNSSPPLFPPTSPRRGSKSGEEERLRMKLFQMRKGHSFQPSSEGGGGDKAVKYNGPSRPTDVGSTLGARTNSKRVSRTTSAVTSSSHPQQFPSTLSMSSTSDGEEQNSVSSDDDIPLAQRIPGALTAQQSIRKQVNEEREARRSAREKRRRERQVTLRPAGAGLGGVESTAGSSSQDLHIAASSSNSNVVGNALSATGSVRQRSGSVHHRQKMPNIPLAIHGDFSQTFKPEDLARKLQNVKMIGESPTVSNMRFQQQSQALINKLSRSVSSASRPSDYPIHATTSVSPAPRLVSKRSFHAPEVEHQSRAVSPQDNLPPRKRSISVNRGDWERKTRRGNEDSVPPLPNTTLHARTNLDDHRDQERRVLVKPHGDSKVVSSYDVERLQHNTDSPIGGVEDVGTTKHRIFIHNLQHSQIVDIRMDTSAGDLITSLEIEGVLDGWAGLGGWMVWEIARDFGMGKHLLLFRISYV